MRKPLHFHGIYFLKLFKVFTPGGWQRAEMWVPGELGGANWGSLSVHPEKQLAILPLNHLLTGKRFIRAYVTV